MKPTALCRLAGLFRIGNSDLICDGGLTRTPSVGRRVDDDAGRAEAAGEQQLGERAAEGVAHEDRRLVERVDHAGQVVDGLRDREVGDDRPGPRAAPRPRPRSPGSRGEHAVALGLVVGRPSPPSCAGSSTARGSGRSSRWLPHPSGRPGPPRAGSPARRSWGAAASTTGSAGAGAPSRRAPRCRGAGAPARRPRASRSPRRPSSSSRSGRAASPWSAPRGGWRGCGRRARACRPAGSGRARPRGRRTGPGSPARTAGRGTRLVYIGLAFSLITVTKIRCPARKLCTIRSTSAASSASVMPSSCR